MRLVPNGKVGRPKPEPGLLVESVSGCWCSSGDPSAPDPLTSIGQEAAGKGGRYPAKRCLRIFVCLRRAAQDLSKTVKTFKDSVKEREKKTLVDSLESHKADSLEAKEFGAIVAQLGAIKRMGRLVLLDRLDSSARDVRRR